MSVDSGNASKIGVVTGIIGAVVTIVLYWVNLTIFAQPLITATGVWITVVISVFLTGWVPIRLNSGGGMGIGFAAGFIGGIITVVLYWINLIVFGQPFVTTSGAWITVIVSAFLTGWVPFAIGS